MVAHLPVVSLLLVVALAAVHGEYCKQYPGDIAFSYSTTQDENVWLQNYQNAYTAKKGGDGGAYKIYRRRTIITTRRRHGSSAAHPRPIYAMNAMNNVNNDIQIQQVQQQVQQVPSHIAPSFPEFAPDEASNGTEAEEEEPPPEPLPIWKITIPRQVSRAIIARIENAQVAESFELNSTHFQNPNLTTASSSRRSVVSVQSVATRTIDITDQSIVPDSWYAVCVSVNIVDKGKPHSCDHCTLIKARIDSGDQKFLDIDWETHSFKNTSAEVRFSAVDIPFPWATVRSKIWTQYTHPRCQDDDERIVFESKDFAYPDSFTYLLVKNLVGKMSYDVRVDVEFPWKMEPKGVLPVPFAANDYLHGDGASMSLAKCEDYAYKGD